MSRELLATLSECNAFLPTAKRVELAADHVPFDRLTGRETTEARLERAVAEEGCIAVVGATGTGKSSVIAHTSEELGRRGFAVMRIGVLAAERGDIMEAAQFAHHAVREVLADQEAKLTGAQRQALMSAAADKRVDRRGGSVGRAGLKARPIPQIEIELAGELRSVAHEHVFDRNASEATAGLRRIVQIVNAQLIDGRSRRPVFIVEDTDAWLGEPPEWELIGAFFNQGIRLLAREVDAAVLIAVHPRYRESEGYRSVRELLVEEVHVPRFDAPAGPIREILAHRLARAGVDADVTDVFEGHAIATLADLYTREEGSIRATLSAANYALEEPEGAEVVTAEAVRYAIRTKLP